MITLERLPMEGACRALRPPGHAAHVYDLLGTGDTSWTNAVRSVWRLPVEATQGWRRRVVAPSVGTVHSLHDGEPDRPTVNLVRDAIASLVVKPLRHGRNLAAMAGNHVVIEVDGGYVLLAHLRNGSVPVEPGQPVEPGTVVGEVGNSGNTVAPHLHVQVMTAASPLEAEILPWRLASFERWTGSGWEQVDDAPPPVRTRLRAR